jgi:hypothetical protein
MPEIENKKWYDGLSLVELEHIKIGCGCDLESVDCFQGVVNHQIEHGTECSYCQKIALKLGIVG